MLKADLQAKVEELEDELQDICDELDQLQYDYEEVVSENEELLAQSDITISDIDHFKHRLELEGLLTAELANFIEDYMRFYNE